MRACDAGLIFMNRERFLGLATLAVFLVLCLLSSAAVSPAQTPLSPAGRNGIVVFGPHPDDAELGCSGIILQALARGEPVHVVVVTNGDGDTPAASGLARKPVDKLSPEDYLALARSRQLQSQKARAVLGLKVTNLIMLGYPDSGLDAIYHESSSVLYKSQFTGKSETYGLAQPDFHSTTHGRPAPYTRDSVENDIAEIITKFKPSQIFVTTEADAHPDHSVSYLFIRDAIRKTGYRGKLYTYLIHAAHGVKWPWPQGVAPNLPFEPPHASDSESTFQLSWPPDKEILLTGRQAQLKLKAIRCHKLTMSDPAQDAHHETNMESFVKSNEVFWDPAVGRP